MRSKVKKTRSVLDRLPQREIEALDRYVAMHGNDWRVHLRRAWSTGSNELRKLKAEIGGARGLDRVTVCWQRTQRSRRLAA